MRVLQTNRFKKAVRKFFAYQKYKLDKVVRLIAEDPNIGIQKKGDLRGVYVHKFKINTQLYLLAYTYDELVITLTLLAVGPHDNFYRDIKQN